MKKHCKEKDCDKRKNEKLFLSDLDGFSRY